MFLWTTMCIEADL